VKHRGDAVGDRLPVAVDERDVDRKIHARAGHHLPLECVAMQVDDSRQHQQPTRVDRKGAAALVGSDRADIAARDPQGAIRKFVAEQNPAAFNKYVGHDVALRRLL
jgi:hypothetical protein